MRDWLNLVARYVRGASDVEEVSHFCSCGRVRRRAAAEPGAGQEGQRRHGHDAGAAAAIAEVTLYNLYETLTKVNEDGSVSPLLAESWKASDDLKTYTFKLRKGVKFHNGEPFDSAAVKFSYERNAAANSTNKDKSLYQAFESVTAPDADTVVIAIKYSEPNLPFLIGQASGSIVEPKSAPTNITQPVGTGPYTLGGWAKGSSITLV